MAQSIKQDLIDLRINMSEDDIKKMKKEQFKKFVNQKTREFAFKELMKVKRTRFNMTNFIYNHI